MFRQAGLRFDEDFLSNIFFNGQRVVFQTYSPNNTNSPLNDITIKQSAPALFGTGIGGKLARFLIKKVFGIKLAAAKNLDIYCEIRLKIKEATNGLEKEITVKRGKQKKKLAVIIPAGIKSGTRIRLNGMGNSDGEQTGDVYVTVRVF
ncbi:MAG: hypothetical protein FWH42_01865 [Dehalococcoidia bacterium]|nr:hypothetical protein [Dehalococcoidia bacterium]